MSKLTPMKLGIVGQPSSGKDTVAEYLKDHHGFEHFSCGDFIRFYVLENKMGKLTRPVLKKAATLIREKFGTDYLMRTALDAKSDLLVVSGTRNPEDVVTLKKAGGKVININVPLRTRYDRVIKRGRTGDDLTFEEFKEQQEAEHANSNPNAQNIGAVIDMADYTIENDGTVEDLHRKIDDLLMELAKA